MSSSSVPIHELLVHADFLRQLAHDLVGPSDADDLAQEVWIKALRTPPASRESIRGWLATTARNLRANLSRTEIRRDHREREVARPEALPSSRDVLEREQVRESVVRAVLSLDEPFREALLLRYYVGLAPRVIARRLGVPPATVRSRIARGLERLRLRLDGEHGRGAWSMVLASWFRWPAPGATVIGELILMKKVALILAVLVLCGIVLRVAMIRPDPVHPVDEQASAPPASTAPAELQESEASGAVEALRTPVQAQPPPAPVGSSRIYPAERGLGAVHGDVVDELDQPVEGALVQVRPHMGHLPPGLVIDDDRTYAADARTDSRGRFRFEGLEAGPMRIQARDADGRSDFLIRAIGAESDAGPFRLRLRHAPEIGDDVSVLVVDGQGQPVGDADVEVFAWSHRMREFEEAERGRTEPLLRGKTDAEGLIAVSGLGIVTGIVTARASDGRMGQAALPGLHTQRANVRVTLSPPGSVHARFEGLDPRELEGATLGLHFLASLDTYFSSGGRRIDVAVVHGEATVAGLAPGTYGLSLDAPSGARLVVSTLREREVPLPNSVEMPSVEVRSGVASELTVRVANGSRIRGRVSAQGQPVAGAQVRAVIAPAQTRRPSGFVRNGTYVWRLEEAGENGPVNPLAYAHATTDAQGRYELRGLQPGSYRVEVAAQGLSFDRRLEVALGEGETVELRHELESAGVLQVAALNLICLGVLAPDATAPTMLAITRDDCATFPGLPAGRWVVARFTSDPDAAPQLLGEAQVVAGRTTWLDLRAASVELRLRGVVLAGGAPVAGAELRVSAVTTRTDSKGSFLLELGHDLDAPSMWGGIVVRHGGAQYYFDVDEQATGQDLELTLELGDQEVDLVVSASAHESLAGQVQYSWRKPNDFRSALQGINGKLPLEAGRVRLSHIPKGVLQGVVQLEQGFQWSFEAEVPRSGALTLEVPGTGVLRVQVVREGQPLMGVLVHASTWAGSGAAPDDEESFTGNFRQMVKSGRDGIALLRVRAGEVLVTASRGGGDGLRNARIRVDPDSEQELTLALD